MSAFAYVKQYFSTEGIAHFPAVYCEHKKRAARYEGFVSLRRLLPLCESSPDEIFLLLEFFCLGLKPLYLAFLIFFSPHSSARSVIPMGRGFQRSQPCCQWRGAFSP